MKKVKIYLVIIIIAIMLVPITCSATNDYDETSNSIQTRTTDILLEEDTADDLVDEELIGGELIEGEEINVEPINAELYDDTLEDVYSQYSDSVIYDDVYQSGDDIILDESVSGNVYLFGNNVTISSGYIYGSVFVFANTITIENTFITGNIFAAGETITMNGTATDIYVAGSKFYLGEESEIYRDIRIASQKVDIKGYVSRNAYIGSDNILISDSAAIDGDLEYYSNSEANIPAGVIYGNVNFVKEEAKTYTKTNVGREYAVSLISKLVLTLVIATFIIFCMPKFVAIEKEQNVTNKLLVSLGLGIATLILIPILSIILLITIIGAPVSAILMMVYVLLFLIASSITSIVATTYIVDKIKPESNSKLYFLGITALVTIVMWIITKIPYIGFAGSCIFGLVGIGLVISYMFRRDKKVKGNEIV